VYFSEFVFFFNLRVLQHALASCAANVSSIFPFFNFVFKTKILYLDSSLCGSVSGTFRSGSGGGSNNG